MLTVKMFSTEEELQELTGLENYEELVAAGFDLDDWDFGIQLDQPIEEAGDAIWWLENWMSTHGTGYQSLFCNGFFYYLAYHS